MERRTAGGTEARAGDTATDEGEARGDVDRTATRRDAERATVDRPRQYERYGGLNVGAVFFGWLVAIGVSVLLVALLSAAGTAVGLTQFDDSAEVTAQADTLSFIGGVLLVAVLLLGYLAGGYVAGRMSRFDGDRQGFGVWALGLIVTLLLAALGAIAGAEYNVFAELELPRIPVDEGDLTTGGAIALALIVIGTALTAIAGGKLGERYHRNVDRAGYVRD